MLVWRILALDLTYMQMEGESEGSLCCSLDLEWRRGRIFDADVACVFQRIVSESGSLKVTAAASTEDRRHRPHGERYDVSTSDLCCRVFAKMFR